ncbi:hypothetical protein DQ155_26075, partial [Escherichia coli]|nr:hypothetical protein [Escherichia coli]
CTDTLRPRREWRGLQKMRQENACKAMHLIDAWLFSVKTGGFSGNFTQTDVMPVAHFYAKKSCSAQE